MTYVSAPLADDASETTDEEYLAQYRSRHDLRDHLNPWHNGQAPVTRPEALRLIGEVLYAVRLPDGLIKIGWSKNLWRRLHHLPGSTLLAIKPGNRAAERAVHDSLAAHVHHGREWYNATPEVTALVNSWRADLGRLPIGGSDGGHQ